MDTTTSALLRMKLGQKRAKFNLIYPQCIISFRIKDKINNAPEKKDFQKVSHSLARFIQLKDAAKADVPKNGKRQKRTVGAEDRPGNDRSEWECLKSAGIFVPQNLIFPFICVCVCDYFDHFGHPPITQRTTQKTRKPANRRPTSTETTRSCPN